MPPRPGLTRDTIVRTAAELADASDGREITLKELAGHLGVRTPSLYNHIGGQDELRRELAVYGVRQIEHALARATVGISGDGAVRALAQRYRVFAHEHPGLYRFSQRAPSSNDAAGQAASVDVLRVIRQVLQHYRLSEADEIHAIRALRSLVHGFVSLELSGGFGMPVDIDSSFQALLEMYIRGLQMGNGNEPVILAGSGG